MQPTRALCRDPPIQAPRPRLRPPNTHLDDMTCSVCGEAGHNRSTCPKAIGIHKAPRSSKPRNTVKDFMNVPRGFRPVRLPDGQIVLMKHEHLYPEKVQCECGVQVSAVEYAQRASHGPLLLLLSP